jgi:membrane protein
MKNRFLTIAKDMIYRFKDDNIMALSSQLSYSILTSAFPFLIFILTISPFLKLDENKVLQSLEVLVSSDSLNLIKKIVSEVLNTKRPHLIFFSFIFGISSLASGVKAVMNGLNKAYDEPEKRPFFKVWFICITGTIAIALIITLSFTMLVLGESLGDYFQNLYGLSDKTRFWWYIIRLLLSIILLIILFAASYYFFPSMKSKITEVIPGALFSSIGWIITSIGFAYYVNHFSNYTKFYGSIDTIFILMAWIYISSIFIIIGGELNASLLSKRVKQENGEIKNS